MRAGRVIWITIGTLVSALLIVLLFVHPKPERVAVTLLYQTNKFPARWYVVEVINMTHSPHLFSASIEYDTSGKGTWQDLTSQKHRSTLKPSQKYVFPLHKADARKARIVVVYGRVATTRVEEWLISLKALTGIQPKTTRIYIDPPPGGSENLNPFAPNKSFGPLKAIDPQRVTQM